MIKILRDPYWRERAQRFLHFPSHIHHLQPLERRVCISFYRCSLNLLLSEAAVTASDFGDCLGFLFTLFHFAELAAHMGINQHCQQNTSAEISRFHNLRKNKVSLQSREVFQEHFLLAVKCRIPYARLSPLRFWDRGTRYAWNKGTCDRWT